MANLANGKVCWYRFRQGRRCSGGVRTKQGELNQSTAEIVGECSVLGALQNCDFISFILGCRESETTCLFQPHRLAALPSIDK